MTRQYRLTATNETALFMHGGRGTSYSEIRPTAIRGAMRFWFRALIGAEVGLDSLKRLEGLVFGDERIGQRLTVRVQVTGPYKEISTRDLSPLPHKEAGALKNVSGIRPGQRFEIKLGSTESGSSIECALWSLWTAANLGGFGQRARRGAGSFKLLEIDTPLEGMKIRDTFADGAELCAYLERGLANAKTCLREFCAESGEALEGAQTRTFPTLSGSDVRVVVKSYPEADEQEMRKSLMLALRPFKNQAFGLPLKVDGKWVGESKRGDLPRYASPLWVRFVKTGAGWAGVFTLMGPIPPGGDPQKISEFLAAGEEPQQQCIVV